VNRSVSRIIFSTVLSALFTPVMAIDLILPLVDGWAETNGRGFGAEVANLIIQNGDFPDTRIKYLPFARAMHEFEIKKYGCLLGGDQDLMKKFTGIESISSDPILESKFVIYSNKEDKVAHLINDIKGYKVGYVLGGSLSAYGVEDIETTFIPIPNSENGFKMLEFGRINYFIHYFPEKIELVKDSVFDPSLSLVEYSDRFQCHNSSVHFDFLKKVNNSLQEIKDAGFYDEVFNRYYGAQPKKNK